MTNKYSDFEKAYEMLSDEYSRTVFCETLLLKHYGESNICLSFFLQNSSPITREVLKNSSNKLITWKFTMVYSKESLFAMF